MQKDAFCPFGRPCVPMFSWLSLSKLKTNFHAFNTEEFWKHCHKWRKRLWLFIFLMKIFHILLLLSKPSVHILPVVTCFSVSRSTWSPFNHRKQFLETATDRSNHRIYFLFLTSLCVINYDKTNPEKVLILVTNIGNIIRDFLTAYTNCFINFSTFLSLFPSPNDLVSTLGIL